MMDAKRAEIPSCVHAAASGGTNGHESPSVFAAVRVIMLAGGRRPPEHEEASGVRPVLGTMPISYM